MHDLFAISIGPFFEILRSVDKTLSETIDKLTLGFQLSILLVLIATSFAYGIIHSIGPGHGKIIIASFFLKEKHPLKKSLLLAGIIAIFHNGSAVILSFLFYFILTGIKGLLKIRIHNYFNMASGILLTAVGLIFIVLKLMRQGEVSAYVKNRNLALVGISAGIVPCPVAVMIMIFALSKNHALIGLLSVTCISIGMLFLLAAVGFAAIKSREGILRISEKMTRKAEAVSSAVEYLSILVIMAIGVKMIFGT